VTWEELKELARSDLVDIGSHSRTHRILSDADDDASWDEIHGSRRDLERRLDVEIASFCFPNGLPADYRGDQVEMLSRAGYSCAVASHFGYVTSESNRFALPRIGDVFRDMTRFRLEVDGLEYLRRRVRGERPF
jgi:peptidoglycan/xylan/chitin deacetylase (PgdA/CDA1 family)